MLSCVRTYKGVAVKTVRTERWETVICVWKSSRTKDMEYLSEIFTGTMINLNEGDDQRLDLGQNSGLTCI